MKRLADKVLKTYTFFIIMILYLPIAVLVVFSFNKVESIHRWGGFTLEWYKRLFTGQAFVSHSAALNVWEAFYNSIWVALVTGVISAILGVLLAYGISRFTFRGKDILEGLLYIPIIIPEIASSLSLLLFYIWIRFPLGGWSVVIGHTTFSISYCMVVIRTRFAGFDKSLEEAAKTLGADEIQTFLRITLPIIFPGILAAFLLTFTLSYDDFIKTAFTRGPGFLTLPILIWTWAKRGLISPELNALATLSLSVSITLTYLYAKLQK